MADRIYASVVNQKNITQVDLQVLSIISAQINNVIEAQIGIAAAIDPDVIDL